MSEDRKERFLWGEGDIEIDPSSPTKQNPKGDKKPDPKPPAAKPDKR